MQPAVDLPGEYVKLPVSEHHRHVKSRRYQTHNGVTRRKKLLSAIFYGICSFLIVSVNKIVLTNWQFPSFQVLAVGQLVSTIVILLFLRFLGYIHFPLRVFHVSRQIMPLPVLHAGNLLFGLGGTQRVNLPMFIALRRLSIFLTMLGEMFLLNEWPSLLTCVSVLLMIGGAVVAAFSDMTFDVGGYTLVICSAGFTAVSNVYTKQALREQLAGAGGKYSILFYNALLVLPVAAMLAYWNGELDRVYLFPHMSNVGFLGCFFLSCIMALLLNYSTVLCLNYNTALTTTVVGCLKNILTTYAGMMFLGGDYVFSYFNFVGINVSIAGSLIYSAVLYKQTANTDANQTIAAAKSDSEPGAQDSRLLSTTAVEYSTSAAGDSDSHDVTQISASDFISIPSRSANLVDGDGGEKVKRNGHVHQV